MKIDLTEITSEDFEFLIEDILIKKGFSIISRPSRGPDLGKDIIVERYVQDDMKNTFFERYLVECKHFAVSKKSVRENDLKNIVERIKLHKANRYLIATSTVISEVVNNQLKAISSDESTTYKCAFWTKNDILETLKNHPEIAKKYFEILDWKKVTQELADQLQKHHFEAHRGAILYIKNITAVFGNDGYKSSKAKERKKINEPVLLEIENLRKLMKKRNEKEIAFGLSRDQFSWVMLVESNKTSEYNKVIWECIDIDASLKKTQFDVAYRQIWSFQKSPFK